MQAKLLSKWSMMALIFMTVLFACQKNGKSGNKNQAEETTVSGLSINDFEKTTLSQKLEGCEGDTCTEISIEFWKLKSNEEEFPNYNQSIVDSIKSILSNQILYASEDQTLAEMQASFFKTYQEVAKQFSTHAPWYIHFSAKPAFVADQLLSIRLNLNTYLGGAHPNSHVQFINYLQNGVIGTRYDDLFDDMATLQSISEKHFRIKYHLQPEDELANAGFIFQDNQFELSKTFGFNENGLILYYNSYEIAPYADGPTEILIPKDEIVGLLRFPVYERSTMHNS